MTVKLDNSSGKIFYGLHFYPGVARYQEPERDLMVFLNEETIRQMDPTFAGKPVFVMHVDGVERSVDKLRNEADGWVIESFFNEADGKHWVKMIICSSLGLQAIERDGMRLSNCYLAKGMGPGGKWNGVPYDAQVTMGEHEHMALVPNPRYEESMILTPDQFKAYNERQREELKRLSNQGDKGMKLKFWNKAPLKDADAVNLAATTVALKSGREVTIEVLVNEMDEHEEKKKAQLANEEDHVHVGDEKMKVGELKKKYQDMYNELSELKAKHAPGGGEEDEETKKKNAAEAERLVNEAKEKEAELEKAKAEVARLQNEADARKKADDTKKARDKAEAEKLRNAGPTTETETVTIELPMDQIERGRQRYG